MRLLALSFVVLSLNLAQSQAYIPTLTDRASWTIEIGEGMGSFRYAQYTLGCDSVLINDQYYQELFFNDPNLDCQKETPSYVREDTLTRQVFYYNSNLYDGEEVLVADYTLAVGDTLVTFPVFEGEEERRLVVDTIFNISFAGMDRTFWGFENQVYGYFEGTGNVWSGVLPSCNPNRYTVNIDREAAAIDCNGAVGTDDAVELIQLTTYPNPVRDHLSVSWQNAYAGDLQYHFFNAHGQRLMQGKLTTSPAVLSFNTLPAGLYVLQLLQDGQVVASRRIIRQP